MDILRTDLFLGPAAATFLIGFCTIVLISWYSTRNHDYWKKRGVPFAKTVPFFGSMYQSFMRPMQDYELKRYFELGTLYGHFEGNNPLLSVADPALLREILVRDFHIFPSRRSISTGHSIIDKMVSTLEGEDWKRVRTIITPTFTTGKIKRMLNIFKDCSKTVVQNFKQAGKDGKPVVVKRIYGAFSMDVIASSAFSTKLDSHNDPENKFAQMARRAFGLSFTWRFGLFALAPGLVRFLKMPLFDPKATMFFKEVTMQIIEERKRTGQKRNDFLQLLIDTANEVEKEQVDDKVHEEITSNYGEETSELKAFKNVTNKDLSIDELVAQCVIFFLAGYDTTASTLSFTTYLLALNPDIQDKLRVEVDNVLQEYNGELTYEAIQSMKYLDNVISETLRIFPPAVRLERQAVADYKLGDTGITIPKGMIITIPNYALHRDPKYFPEPEKFNPDRFTVEERSKRDQFTYMPFGAGPRNCIGMRFALMEVKACLAQILATFIIKRCPQTKVPLEFYIGQSLLQPKDILIRMEERKDGPLVK